MTYLQLQLRTPICLTVLCLHASTLLASSKIYGVQLIYEKLFQLFIWHKISYICAGCRKSFGKQIYFMRFVLTVYVQTNTTLCRYIQFIYVCMYLFPQLHESHKDNKRFAALPNTSTNILRKLPLVCSQRCRLQTIKYARSHV